MNTTTLQRFFISLGLSLLLLLLTATEGCTVLHIQHTQAGVTSKVPGVPFFPKRARCRQEIVWLEPIYTLNLAALVPDKDGTLQSRPRGSVTLSLSAFQSDDVKQFVKTLNHRPTNEAIVQAGWDKIVANADPQVLSRSFANLGEDDRILLARSAAPAVYVDYADQYYINAKSPLSGSANVDVKVAEDGSLTEASGQLENKTLDTILGALPISSVITGELGLAAGKSIEEAGNIEAYQLTIGISGYRHTLAHFVDYPVVPTPCPVAAAISLAAADEYKREDISTPTDSTAKDNSAKKDNNSADGNSKGDKTGQNGAAKDDSGSTDKTQNDKGSAGKKLNADKSKNK